MLEARLDTLTRPPKTPDNASKPPLQEHQLNIAPPSEAARKSRPGVGLTLHPDLDRIIDPHLPAYPKCHASLSREAQTPEQVYEHIELPPVKPDVAQVQGNRVKEYVTNP